jgi:hypothetical protein
MTHGRQDRGPPFNSLFGWLVADGWCWFLLREEYCWLVASGWFVLREKYCWLVADKPSEQGAKGWEKRAESISQSYAKTHHHMLKGESARQGEGGGAVRLCCRGVYAHC